MLEGAYVHKVILESDDSGTYIVKGVQYEQGGIVKTISASKEVIISAGEQSLATHTHSAPLSNGVRILHDTQDTRALR